MPPPRGQTTLKDVAQRAGVAVSTASLILNGHQLRFSEASIRKVREAAQQLGYRPDSIAVRSGRRITRRDVIGFLIRSESESHLANTSVYEFLCGINDAMLDHRQLLVTVKLDQLRDGDEQPRLVSERFVDGLIIETGLPPAVREAIEWYQLLAVWLNSDRQEAHDCVYPDEVHAGRLVTEHLLKLGHRRVLFASPTRGSARAGQTAADPASLFHYSLLARRSGYEQAMRDAGLKPHTVTATAGHDGTAEAESDVRTAVIHELIRARDAGTPHTAIVCQSLGLAVHLIQSLQERGLRVPQDLSVVAAEDVHVFRRTWSHITGVRTDRYTMGQWAGEMIVEKVRAGGAPQPSKVYCGTLIEGSTTMPPPQ